LDSTTEALARYVTGLRYDDLTPAALRETRRHIVDTFGCAMGGYTGDAAAIARRVAAASGGSPSARLLGDGRFVSMEMAAFANGVSVRYLDANDSYMSVGSGHPSDLFSAVLAAADAVGASGKALMLATVAGYEVFGALADQVALRERGWDQGVFVAPAAAAGAGVLLALTFEEMANALAIAVTANVPTRQTRAGELAMWKGSATAAAAKAGLFAAQLAKAGMTGPTAAFEGLHGVWEQVTGPFTIGTLGGKGAAYAIERSNLKVFPSEYHSQAPLWTVLSMRDKVKLEEIEAINVQTYGFAYSEIGSEPAKWDPQSRETADHSLPYLLAVALRDGRITPAVFEPERFLERELRPLMARIRITENAAFTREFPRALISEIEIITRSGERLVERTGYPKGHARNPMSDADLELKFKDFCGAVLKPAQIDVALRSLWRLEEAAETGQVLDLFRVQDALP
jgi:2-methylcitrate dehydratase